MPLTRPSAAARVLLAMLGTGCAPRAAPAPMVEGALPNLRAGAAAHYAAYGEALTIPRRAAIAGFYHPDGALVVLNGVSRHMSQADLRRKYEGPWTPPAFFTWEGLAFDSIAPGQVIVTGGFQWQRAGQPDTARYLYAALLMAADSGLAIVFEHETLRPRP